MSYLAIGKFGKPYGIKGFVKFYFFSDTEDKSAQSFRYFIYHNKMWQPLTIEKLERHGQEYIIKLTGYDSPEAARVWSNQVVYISKDQLPQLPPSQYYYADLIGCDVYDEHHRYFGKVDHILEVGSQDVLVVKGEKEHLIPFKKDIFIKKVDLKESQIIVEWDYNF